MTDGITAFVEARLTEDEAVALAACCGPGGRVRPWSVDFAGHWTVDPWYDVTGERSDLSAGVGGALTGGGALDNVVTTHIVRHDPARVLRDVQCTRAILDVMSRWGHNSCADGWYSCSQATEAAGFPIDETCADDDRAGEPCDCGLEARRLAILRPLALRFADHPDYDETWRV